MNPQNGDILLLKGKSLFSKIVKWWTKSEYSHSAMFATPHLVIESDFGGVQFNLTEKYKNMDYDVYRHKDITRNQQEKVFYWSFSKTDKGYDHMGLLGIVLGTTSLDNKSRYWCSEFNMDAYIHAGVKIDCDKDTHRVTPQDIANDSNFEKVIEYRESKLKWVK